MDALRGVTMELDDCAFPLLRGMVPTDDPDVAFADADIALLVGSRPGTAGMERSDLLEANAAIFSVQGKALNDHASRDVKVLVVGNPANTNCLIAQRNAPDLDPRNFTAMTRLDHNRALGQLAAKTGAAVDDIAGLAVWGNHSPTMYPDLTHATVGGRASPRAVWGPRLGRERLHARRYRNVGPRSSKHAARRARPPRPMPPSTTSATGSAARTASSAWGSCPTAATASPRA